MCCGLKPGLNIRGPNGICGLESLLVCQNICSCREQHFGNFVLYWKIDGMTGLKNNSVRRHTVFPKKGTVHSTYYI